MIKLSLNETQWSSLLARARALILYISIWIFDFGPVKLPGLSRNGPQGGLFSQFTQALHSNNQKQIHQTEHSRIKNPATSRRQPVGYLQASDRGFELGDTTKQIQQIQWAHGTRTRDHGIANPTCWPLGHAASYTAVSRKVVGKSARDNPERYCGWF